MCSRSHARARAPAGAQLGAADEAPDRYAPWRRLMKRRIDMRRGGASAAERYAGGSALIHLARASGLPRQRRPRGATALCSLNCD
eukprot:scaffold34050_cov112-Isochrysis_galbana.AAC.5